MMGSTAVVFLHKILAFGIYNASSCELSLVDVAFSSTCESTEISRCWESSVVAILIDKHLHSNVCMCCVIVSINNQKWEGEGHHNNITSI